MKKQPIPIPIVESMPTAIINFTTPKPIEWLSNEKTVIGGQSMSLQAINHKIQNGIPVMASGRTVETYYRNLDLVDQQNLQHEAKALAEKVKLAAQKQQAAKEKAEAEEKSLFEKFKEQFNEKKSEPTGPTS